MFAFIVISFEPTLGLGVSRFGILPVPVSVRFGFGSGSGSVPVPVSVRVGFSGSKPG